MDLMHLPRLEKIGTRDKEKVSDVKLKQATSTLDSAYASSEDGNSSTTSLHRFSTTQSSGIASASSRNSLITEIDDDSPPSRSITPDSTYRIHSPLSRNSSVECGDSSFTGTLHEPGDVSVIVTVTTEPDGDTISCDEEAPSEAIDKLFQTVALPMLWNLPGSANDSFLFLETGNETANAENEILGSTGPIIIDVPGETDDGEPTLTFDGRTVQSPSTDGALCDSVVERTSPSTGCLTSSRLQLRSFFASCRDYFTSKSFNVRL